MYYGTLYYLLYALFVMLLQEQKDVSAVYNFPSVLLYTLHCKLIYIIYVYKHNIDLLHYIVK